MKISSLIFIIFVIFFSIYGSAFAKAPFSMGVNLDDEGAFINIMNHTNRFMEAISYDVNGWPESDFKLVLMDGRPAQEWNNAIDDPEQYRIDYSGTYKCSFTGSADISIWGSGSSVKNILWDETQNLTNFDLIIPGPPSANHGIVLLTFKNTTRSVEGPTNKGITNLRVYRPGYSLDTKQIFTNEFINLCKAADFSCYRFYNLQNIWDGEPTYPERTIWSKRKTPIDVSQLSMTSLNGKRDAWCWEYIIELANILNKDIWINLHISCDSNYVASLAKMLKDQLNPEINIYVENSNEVWSPTQNTHGPYNNSQAAKYGISFNENYARRTVELSEWFALVFGDNEINQRIRVILAGQHSYSARSDIHLNYINKKFGPPKQYIYALSPALYFGSTNQIGTVDEINDGMFKDINAQINTPTDSRYRKNHIDKADYWGFPGGCTSYEGGPHLPAGGGTANLSNQILAHRTKKMGDAVKLNYLQGWKDLGGGLAMYFTLSSGYNRYGCWGLTDDFNKPDRNFKMQAIRDIISEINGIEATGSNNSIKFYPNPVSDELTIDLNDNYVYLDFEILNSLGQVVLRGNLTENQVIKTSNFPSGLYLMKFENGRELGVIKFIKD